MVVISYPQLFSVISSRWKGKGAYCLQREGPVGNPSLFCFCSVFYIIIRLPDSSFWKMKVDSHWEFHTNGLICVAIFGMLPWIRPSEGLYAAVSWLAVHSQCKALQNQQHERTLISRQRPYSHISGMLPRLNIAFQQIWPSYQYHQWKLKLDHDGHIMR